MLELKFVEKLHNCITGEKEMQDENKKFVPPSGMFKERTNVVAEQKTTSEKIIEKPSPLHNNQEKIIKEDKKIGVNYDLEKFKSDVIEVITEKLEESKEILEDRLNAVDESLKSLQDVTHELKKISTVYAEINDAIFNGNEKLSNIVVENSKEILQKIITVEDVINREESNKNESFIFKLFRKMGL